MIFKIVFCYFLLMKQLLPKTFFSMSYTLRGKNDVQMIFDDSYVFCVSNNEVFISIAVLFYIIKQLVLSNFSL